MYKTFTIDLEKLADLLIKNCKNTSEKILEYFGDNIHDYLLKLGFPGDGEYWNIEDIFNSIYNSLYRIIDEKLNE